MLNGKDWNEADMINFSINHMSVPNLTYRQLLSAAKQLGCVGVEVRNDLKQNLFGDLSATHARTAADESQLRLLALAELSAFNVLSEKTFARAQTLIKLASDCGAEGVVLIPRCDGQQIGTSERKANLHTALTEIKPLLIEHSVIGFIEPLGFEHSSLRIKSEAVEAIESVAGKENFKLVHDTFHHYLEGSQNVFSEYTGMVHVSGVIETRLSRLELRDEHRGFVDEADRIENIAQLNRLFEEAYCGPVSMEAFAPEVHRMAHPVEALAQSFDYMASALGVGAR